MRVRPLIAAACLTSVALLGAACNDSGSGSATDAASPATEEVTASAADTVRAALEKTNEQTSFTITMDLPTMDAEMSIDKEKRNLHMTMSGKQGATTLDMEVMVIGDTMYTQLKGDSAGALPAGKWIETPSTDMQDVFEDITFDPDELLTEGVVVEEVGANMYRVGAEDGGAFGGLFSALGENSEAAADVQGATTLTIGTDGMLQKIAIEGADGTPAAGGSVTLGGYGDPVDVKKPADEDIIKP